ncbi:MAG: MBL fold metallo-hydrolase [Candidatus Methanomethylophilaceae archaeon]|jgi:L-ascorbate metabolism protein UlaG (beta-lactamase superfamily)
MLIRWHGHSCFEFGCDLGILVIDPHDGKSLGIKPPSPGSAAAVLMSHDHYDHNASRVVSGDHKDFTGKTGKFKAGPFEVEGLGTYHDDEQGAKRGLNSMYLFAMDGISVCHCGDLGAIPSEKVMKKIKNVDILFVPVGANYTMDLPEVKEFIAAVDPKVIVPMHYRVLGLCIPILPLDDFLKMVPAENVDYVGNEIDLSCDELPEHSECWVFDR